MGQPAQARQGQVVPTETRISLPMPPSTNNLFINVAHGRAPSASYTKWRIDAGWRLLSQHPANHKLPVRIWIEVRQVDQRRRDLDNKIKPILDLLVTHAVIPADDSRYVREITALWVDAGDDCVVTVRAV